MRAQKPTAHIFNTQYFALPAKTRPVNKSTHYWHLFTYYTLHSWEKIIIILLALNAFRQLYLGTMFIINDYQILEQHFSRHTVQSEEVRTILIEAIALMLDTIVNFTMAVRLSTAQERVSRILELLLGTAVLIWSKQIITYLQTFDYTIITENATFLDLSRYLHL